jgi:hypothetical protein
MSETVTPSPTTLGIWTHIEKTAGTSVRGALEQAVGTSSLYLYSAAGNSFSRAQDGAPSTSSVLDKALMLGFSNPVTRKPLVGLYSRYHNAAVRRMLARGSAEVPSDASVIMGHFVTDQFDEQLSDRPSIRAVVIREPVARMASHYDHWKRFEGHSVWRVQVPYDPAMTFENFATLPEMQNYQVQALGRLGLEDFDVVGVTENVDQSVGQFLRLLAEARTIPPVPGAQEIQIGHYNRTPQGTKTNLEALGGSALQAIRAYHAEDIELYAQASVMSAGAAGQ